LLVMPHRTFPHRHRLLRQVETTLVREGADDPALVVSLGNARPRNVRREYVVRRRRRGNFPRKMPADAWFGFKGCDRFEVEEQSFRLPGDEVLTVLRLPDAAVA
jgi:hypothetical protein